MAHEEKKNHIYSALRKYPFESFSIQSLAEVSTKEELDNLERVWITLLDARNDEVGMNIAVGGEGGWSGLHHSEQSKQKMRAHPNRPHGFKNEEDRIAHSEKMKGAGNPMFGKKRIFSAEWREKLGQAQVGRKHSEETKQKMRDSAMKRWAK